MWAPSMVWSISSWVGVGRPLMRLAYSARIWSATSFSAAYCFFAASVMGLSAYSVMFDLLVSLGFDKPNSR